MTQLHVISPLMGEGCKDYDFTSFKHFTYRDSKQTVPPPPPPAAPPGDFQKKLDDLKTQLASAEKNHASQMKDAESKLSNLQGNSSKEMETLRLQFAKDMEALRKAMEEVQVVL